jgi:two-component system sensor histidine kinase AlgZ
MHPILAFRGRLGPYLAAWVPLAALLAGLLHIAGAPWLEAGVIALPLALAYAFICLAAWYPCRSASLHGSSLAKVLVTQAAAAGLSAILWVFLANTWVVFLEQFPAFAGAVRRFPRLVPVILAVAVILYTLAAALHYLLIAFQDARNSERSALELEVLAREAELRSLRAQIDPHFLFNALNSINSLVGSDPAAARAMCLELAEFLRETLRLGGTDSIPLSAEIALAERYLAVERARFGQRLRIEREVSPEAGACEVPPLMLQPLVENAVKHGVATLVDGGAVRIEARCGGGLLHLAVENPVDPAVPARPGEGLGLANVRSRLAALHAREAQVEVRRLAGTFRVELVLPASTVSDGTVPS